MTKDKPLYIMMTIILVLVNFWCGKEQEFKMSSSHNKNVVQTTKPYTLHVNKSEKYNLHEVKNNLNVSKPFLIPANTQPVASFPALTICRKSVVRKLLDYYQKGE